MSYMPTSICKQSRKRHLQTSNYCSDPNTEDSDADIVPRKQLKGSLVVEEEPTVKTKLNKFFHWIKDVTHLKKFVGSVLKTFGHREDSEEEFEQDEEMQNANSRQSQKSSTESTSISRSLGGQHFERPNRFVTIGQNRYWEENTKMGKPNGQTVKGNRTNLRWLPEYITPNVNGHRKQQSKPTSHAHGIPKSSSHPNYTSLQMPMSNLTLDQPARVDKSKAAQESRPLSTTSKNWLPMKHEPSRVGFFTDIPPPGILPTMMQKKLNGYYAASVMRPTATFTTNEILHKKERDSYKLLLSNISRNDDAQRKLMRSTEVQVRAEDIDKPIKNMSCLDTYIAKHKTSSFRPESKPKLAMPRPVFREVPLEEKCFTEACRPFSYKEERKSPFTLRSTSSLFTDKWIQDLKNTVSEETISRLKKVDEQNQLIAEVRKQKLLLSLISEKPAHLEKEEHFPDITPEMEAVIESALVLDPDHEVLSIFNQQQVLRRDIDTLNSTKWLNDEVINFYLSLIAERSKQPGLPSVYAFSSFFYTSLTTKGYTAVRRWTRKIDVFAYDIILVPLHLGVHWCLAVIDFRQKKLKYYDSMGGKDQALPGLRQYLSEESLDKKKNLFDMSGWNLEVMKGIPPQMNGYDCGMFTLKYAEYITRDAAITFSQHNMQYFRRKMVYDIMMKRIS